MYNIYTKVRYTISYMVIVLRIPPFTSAPLKCRASVLVALTIYMHQPEGFRQQGPNGKQWVHWLIKGLYRLKKSSQLWYHKLGETLEKFSFKCTQSDTNIYIWISDGICIILPVFVEDITIVSKDPDKTMHVKDTLQKNFKIKDLRPSSYLLSIKLDYD